MASILTEVCIGSSAWSEAFQCWSSAIRAVNIFRWNSPSICPSGYLGINDERLNLARRTLELERKSKETASMSIRNHEVIWGLCLSLWTHGHGEQFAGLSRLQM
jgi:hypothetical protein